MAPSRHEEDMTMVELSKERIGQILHEETVEKEEPATILRSIYARYMHMYEKYFADIDALSDDTIAELRSYHEETMSLARYYYMDIPLDICEKLNEFEDKYSANLLGPDWHEYLFGAYKDFKESYENRGKTEACLKTEFTKQALETFYDAMDYVMREGFGTGSETAKDMVSGLTGLLFGKE